MHLASRARDFYRKGRSDGQVVPFLYVMHDGWDSKDFDVMGCSIQLVDPETGQLLTVAVGLQRSKGKKSIEMADHIEQMLRR